MIKVDEVYKTVLLILNKEQRGYMTPNEFNKIGNQVQMEIFERYFDDLAQQARVPQGTYNITMDGVTDLDYTDRLMMTDEKLGVFKTAASLPEQTASTANYPFPCVKYDIPTDLCHLGGLNIIGYPASNGIIEAQRVTRSEVVQLHRSKLTKPSFSKYPASLQNPVYIYENPHIYFFPQVVKESNFDDIVVDYIKRPEDISWAYTVLNNGAFAFDEPNAVNFGLHHSEITEVVLNILTYAGLVIRDPQVVQAASAKVQQQEANEKS